MMTRSKAVSIAEKHGCINGKAWVGAMEELGLIKFDKEVKIDIPNSIRLIMSLDQIEALLVLMVKEGWEFKQKGTTI